MENASRALQIAAGVMLGVMLMALIVFTFKQMGAWPEQQDESLTTEQLLLFNQEYEVYGKKQMYGVDVISCLNKVQSYNNKYVLKVNDGEYTSSGFFTGSSEKYGEEHLIDVCVNIKTPLEENVRFYYINAGKELEVYGDLDDVSYKQVNGGNIPDRPSFVKIGLITKNDEYSKISINKEIQPIANSELTDDENHMKGNSGTLTNAQNGKSYYSLTHDVNDRLQKLIDLNDLKKTITNTGKEYDGATYSVTVWSKVVWETALYDFKKRRFTCDEIEYNTVTGKVKTLYFSEV